MTALNPSPGKGLPTGTGSGEKVGRAQFASVAVDERFCDASGMTALERPAGPNSGAEYGPARCEDEDPPIPASRRRVSANRGGDVGAWKIVGRGGTTGGVAGRGVREGGASFTEEWVEGTVRDACAQGLAGG